MECRIERIEPELREKIINCAFQEFSTHGFDKASYNNILISSGISKGRIYQYVKSKRELYDYLVPYALEHSTRIFIEQVDFSITDYIDRLKKIIDVKLEITVKHPNLFKFLAYIKADNEIDKQHKLKNKDLSYKYAHENIDFSNFRNENHIDQQIKMMNFTLSSLITKAFEETQSSGQDVDIESLKAEIDVYYDIFKTAFYKQEGDE